MNKTNDKNCLLSKSNYLTYILSESIDNFAVSIPKYNRNQLQIHKLQIPVEAGVCNNVQHLFMSFQKLQFCNYFKFDILPPIIIFTKVHYRFISSVYI